MKPMFTATGEVNLCSMLLRNYWHFTTPCEVGTGELILLERKRRLSGLGNGHAVTQQGQVW